MNDRLDSLIRGSLEQHTRAAAPDAELAPRVAALGRRRRANRRAGLAALALVAVGGAAWGISALPPREPQVATAPSTSPTPHATPTPAPRSENLVKDVWSFEESHFASPTGNIKCALRGATGDVGLDARAFCGVDQAEAGVVPTMEEACGPNPDVPVAGVAVMADGKASWVCAGDAQSYPFTDSSPEYIAWSGDHFGATAKQGDRTLVVLPYGRSLVAGDSTCSMATDGVTCTNTATGHGFHLSRAGATLR